MSNDVEIIADVDLTPSTTAEDLRQLITTLDRRSSWSVERVHNPGSDEPDLYVERRAEGDDEEEAPGFETAPEYNVEIENVDLADGIDRDEIDRRVRKIMEQAARGSDSL